LFEHLCLPREKALRGEAFLVRFTRDGRPTARVLGVWAVSPTISTRVAIPMIVEHVFGEGLRGEFFPGPMLTSSGSARSTSRDSRRD
jgi:hypothetical protein